jgi:hypothetical protein
MSQERIHVRRCLAVLCSIAASGCNAGPDELATGMDEGASEPLSSGPAWVSEPSPDFDLPEALDGTPDEPSEPEDSTATPSVRARATRTGLASSVLNTMLCMRRFAGQAYNADDQQVEDCNLKPTPWNNTDVMKLFDSKAVPAGGRQTVVVAFAGTRMPNIGDVLRDLQSQVPSWHKNPLDSGLPQLGYVGSGWDARWYNQAKALKGTLDWYIGDAKKNGHGLDLIVVGHSLGGVAATLAGYDIAQYLRNKGLKQQRVFVFSFNSPRLGGTGSRDVYQDALFASRCPASDSDVCLVLRQFTRSLDPVQSVPLNMNHPVWDTPSWPHCSLKAGPGSHADFNFSYCPQFNAPALSYANPLGNHFLAGWDEQLKSAPDDLLEAYSKP